MLTPVQKIKQFVVKKLTGEVDENGDEIDKAFEALELQDEEEGGDAVPSALDEIRGGEFTTDIAPPYNRHYEARSVAKQMFDGSWVGWTYWYGGGKHGEPSSVPWLDDAYDLDSWEVQETVRKFKKKEEK